MNFESLTKYASMLGSDCAYFLQNDARLGTGRGEILSRINLSLKEKYLVLVKPNIHLNTADAYSAIIPKSPSQSIQSIVENMPIELWRSLLVNDFEESVFREFPEIGELKKMMYSAGAIYASMSGSGSSVFGIFNQRMALPKEITTIVCWSGSI